MDRSWLTVLAATFLLCALLQLLSPDGLRYERQAILDGQLWRLFSGHLLHLGWYHWLLNMAGFAVLVLGFSDPRGADAGFPILSRALLLIALMLGTSLGLLLFSSQLQWYVGLSGLLHGLAIYFAFRLGRCGQLWPGLLLGSGLVAKLAFEQLAGPDADTARRIGGAVVVDAHLYGSVTGLAVVFGIELRRLYKNKSAQSGV